MKRFLFLLLILFELYPLNAQNRRTIRFYPLEHFIKLMNEAKTDLDKIRALIFLTGKYSALGETAKADSCRNEREKIILSSRDRLVMAEDYSIKIQTYIFDISNYDSVKQKGYTLCRELIDIGQRENIPVAKVVGNGYMGWSLAREGKMEQAYSYLSTTLAAAMESGDDSLIAEGFAFYANTYYDKHNYLQAYKYLLNALDIAKKINNDYLLWDFTIWMSNIYGEIGDKEKRIDYRRKLFDFAKKTNPFDNLAALYYLGEGYLMNSDFVPAEQYHLQFLHMADSLGLEKIIQKRLENRFITQLIYNNTKDENIGFSYLEKFPEKWIQFINSQRPDIKDHFLYLYHRYHKNADSAAYYIKKGYDFNYARVGDDRKRNLHEALGRFLNETGKTKESIEEWKKAFTFNEKLAEPERQKENAFQIYDLSKKTGNHVDALLYHEKYVALADSLERINNKNELVLSELIYEQKNHDNVKLEKEAKTRRRHQLQYMVITIGVITFFIFSLMLGFFKVSEKSIRFLGFLAFILIFEFLIMLADKQIHNWTHGEPLYIFLIKIGLIAFLLPLHQLLERKVIHFLVSRKLMRLRDGRFWKLLLGDDDPLIKAE